MEEELTGPTFKRYMVITYDQYYPSGGLGDVEADFDNPEDAIAFINQSNKDFGSVFDRIAGIYIYDKPE